MTESRDELFDQIRRSAASTSDFELDMQLAATAARRDVAVAHKQHVAAAALNDLATMLADIRKDRADVRRDIADMTGPPPATLRPLTDEELADVRFDDEAEPNQ